MGGGSPGHPSRGHPHRQPTIGHIVNPGGQTRMTSSDDNPMHAASPEIAIRLSSVYPQNVYPRNVDPQNFYLRNIYCTYRKSTHIHLPKECLITECLLMNCIHKKCLPVLLDFSGTSPAGTGIVRYIEGKNACGKNRSYTFCTATRVGNSLIGYLSESLVFCPKMSE